MEAKKMELMQLLLDTQQENVLLQLKEVFEKENIRNAMIREQMGESAERSNENIKAGKVYSPEKVEEDFKIIYFISSDVVFITGFFNTRRDPDTMMG